YCSRHRHRKFAATLDIVVYHGKSTVLNKPANNRPLFNSLMKTLRFGRMQHRMMTFLWARGKASARDITDALSKEKPVAHSTVQTLLRKLETKGAIAHDVE